jgi:hypothetical protein
MATSNEVNHDSSSVFIEELRDTLSPQSLQQVERTRNLRRNVVIRIGSRDTRSRSNIDRVNLIDYYSDSLSKIARCCTPLPNMSISNLSYDSPSTQCTTTLSQDDVNDSNSILQSCEGSYHVSDVNSISQDSDDVGLTGFTHNQKVFLRLKENFVSLHCDADEGSTSNIEEGETSYVESSATSDNDSKTMANIDSLYRNCNMTCQQIRDDKEECGDSKVYRDLPLNPDSQPEVEKEEASNDTKQITIPCNAEPNKDSMCAEDEEIEESIEVEKNDSKSLDLNSDNPNMETAIYLESDFSKPKEGATTNTSHFEEVTLSTRIELPKLSSIPDCISTSFRPQEGCTIDQCSSDMSQTKVIRQKPEILSNENHHQENVSHSLAENIDEVCIQGNKYTIESPTPEGCIQDNKNITECLTYDVSSKPQEIPLEKSNECNSSFTSNSHETDVDEAINLERSSSGKSPDRDIQDTLPGDDIDVNLTLQALENIGKALEQSNLELNRTSRVTKKEIKVKKANRMDREDFKKSLAIDLRVISSQDMVPLLSPMIFIEPATVSSASTCGSLLVQQSNSIIKVNGLENIPFIRGSFAAAAPFIIHDLKWKRILRKLLPMSHARAVEQMKEDDGFGSNKIVRMMKWAENNPVVAAFGILSNVYGGISVSEPALSVMSTPMASNKVSHIAPFKKGAVPAKPVVAQSIPPLEWNVFLDPTIVSSLNDVLVKKELAVTRGEKNQMESDVKIQLSRLVKRLVLSHGSTTQLLLEALGFNRAYTFASIVEEMDHNRSGQFKSATTTRKYISKSPSNSHSVQEPKSARTSMFVTKWLATLAAALYSGSQEKNGTVAMPSVFKLAQNSSDEASTELKPTNGMLLCLGFDDQNSRQTEAANNSFGDSAKYISSLLGGPLQVVLNLRSRRIPSRVWARLVDYMRDNDVYVESIASFDSEELRSVASLVSAPIKQYRMFHSAGDLQKACHAGDILEGDSVFFNAASLIATDQDPMHALVCGLDEYNDEVVFSEFATTSDSKVSPVNGRVCMASIADYKTRFNLNIGCYIQEFSVSAHTVECFVDFFNENASIYNLGLAYGGINGQAVGGGLHGDGFGKQRFMGTPWDFQAKPELVMQPLAPWHDPFIQRTMLAGFWGPLGTVNDASD